MKVVICQNTELRVADRPDLVAGKGQVLVKVLRCGICGSDLHMRHHCDQMRRLVSLVGYDAHFPSAADEVVFGHEFCGEVLEHGPGSDKKVKPGTRVVAQPLLRVGNDIDTLGLSARSSGGYAEQILLQELTLVPVPNGLSSDMAALTEPIAVGLHAVRRSEIKPKDVAIVIGCGPVGLAVICMLKAKGVKTVVASDFSAGRRTLAKLCGADIAIDPAETSPYSNWEEFGFLMGRPGLLEMALGTRKKFGQTPLPWWQVWRVAEALGLKRKRPVIFECVGVPGLLQQVIEGAPMASRVVVVGVCMQLDKIQPALAVFKEIDLRFVMGHSPLEYRDSIHFIAEGKVNCSAMITGIVGLHGVKNAFDVLADPEVHAKILINPSSVDIQPVKP